jgi:hypothetical protein
MMDEKDISRKRESGRACSEARPRQLVAADVSRRFEGSHANHGGRVPLWTNDSASIVIRNPPTHVGGYGAPCVGRAVNWDASNRGSSICKSLIFMIFLDISRGPCGANPQLRSSSQYSGNCLCKSLIFQIFPDISRMSSLETPAKHGQASRSSSTSSGGNPAAGSAWAATRVREFGAAPGEVPPAVRVRADAPPSL